MWSEEDLLDTNERYDLISSHNDSHHNESNQNQIPKLYSIHRGKINSIKEFGAFVSLDKFKLQGLLHKSQISDNPINDINNILTVGERLWIKVVKVDTNSEKPKISLSMNLVSQRDGSDLDPNNVKLMLMEKKNKTVVDYTRKKVTLDAILPTTCSKCGSVGHLEFECYAFSTSNNDGKKYDLIDDESFNQILEESKTKKKDKKHSKKHDRDDYDRKKSEKKRKKEKTHKKHSKKRKREEKEDKHRKRQKIK